MSDSEQATQAQLQIRVSQLVQNSQLEVQNSQLEVQNSQLQNILTDHVESASLMSQSKKQKILTWADILYNQDIDMPESMFLLPPHYVL